MHVLNSGPRLRVCTFDGDLVVRLRPGEGAEVEDAKHVDIRDVETEHQEHSHRSLYSTMLRGEPLAYNIDDDPGDAR